MSVSSINVGLSILSTYDWDLWCPNSYGWSSFSQLSMACVGIEKWPRSSDIPVPRGKLTSKRFGKRRKTIHVGKLSCVWESLDSSLAPHFGTHSSPGKTWEDLAKITQASKTFSPSSSSPPGRGTPLIIFHIAMVKMFTWAMHSYVKLQKDTVRCFDFLWLIHIFHMHSILLGFHLLRNWN